MIQKCHAYIESYARKALYFFSFFMSFEVTSKKLLLCLIGPNDSLFVLQKIFRWPRQSLTGVAIPIKNASNDMCWKLSPSERHCRPIRPRQQLPKFCDCTIQVIQQAMLRTFASQQLANKRKLETNIIYCYCPGVNGRSRAFLQTLIMASNNLHLGNRAFFLHQGEIAECQTTPLVVFYGHWSEHEAMKCFIYKNL